MKGFSRKAKTYLKGKSVSFIARLIGRRGAVSSGRRRGKILRASNLWQDWEIRLLRRFSDRDIAKRTGRSRLAIATKRRKEGVLRRRPRFAPEWTPEELALLGRLPDKEIARRL